MEKEILDIKEASELLRVGVRTMYNLAQKGLVPARKIGGRWRFSKSSLMALFNSGGKVESSTNATVAEDDNKKRV